MSLIDQKSTILNNSIYSQICQFIRYYPGLAIDCELDMYKCFPNIYEGTLSSILSTEQINRTKSSYHKYNSQAGSLLETFEKEASKDQYNPYIIINMSIKLQIAPTVLSRILVFEKYQNLSKHQVMNLLKNAHLIKDHCLANNVQASICSDNTEGPIGDIIRRCIGEEYEVKLKVMAKEAGMLYLDEADLRRIGFDKTPDLKLALPCLYKGNVINWIESKALFGDLRSHQRYLTQQLQSYKNRFGAGVVIYWFGYQDDILSLKDNGDNLIILNCFPEKEHLEFLKV